MQTIESQGTLTAKLDIQALNYVFKISNFQSLRCALN